MTENNLPTPENEPDKEKQKKILPEFKTNRELLWFLFFLIKENKKWWLLPWLLVLTILGFFMSLTGNASLLPAIYAFF